MAQAPKPDDPRERAVSSEPCSTRPNPFDDDDNSSRKRRRTSAGGTTSRSRSVETNVSEIEGVQGSAAPGSASAGHQELRATQNSEMKIDSDPVIPSTPEQHPFNPQIPSGPRSSRVTINVRTPSRPLEAIPSSPSSPTSPTLPEHPAPAENVKLSVEESEVDMAREDTATLGTPMSSNSETSDPPVELVSQLDDEDVDEIELGVEEPQITILGDNRRFTPHDPTDTFPFRGESGDDDMVDAISRLNMYLGTHDNVGVTLGTWLETYIKWANKAPFRVVMTSWFEHRDLWQNLPDLVFHMIGRKSPYPRTVRHSIFEFYNSFAKTTALFLSFDVRLLRQWPEDRPRPPDFVSPYYVKALATLTTKEEIAFYANSQYPGLDDGFSFEKSFGQVVHTFQEFPDSPGGTLVWMKTLAQSHASLVPRFPRLADHLAHLALLTSNVVYQCSNKVPYSNHGIREYVEASVNCGHGFYRCIAPAFEELVDKHGNLFSTETASILLQSLGEIYNISLTSNRQPMIDYIREWRMNHPSIAPNLAPEALSHTWKIGVSAKLIMGSQMPLRVMAATSMCADLVGIFRRFGGDSDDANPAFMTCIALVLIGSGLVDYILSPKCHPEVTVESSNIIGFLAVSRTYTKEHTDNLWATAMSTQDPRIAEALIKMVNRIANLFLVDELVYWCEKLQTVPVESFGTVMRDFCDSVFRNLLGKAGAHDRASVISAAYDLCIRLVRQASTYSSQSPAAYQEFLLFATQKFKELIALGSTLESRRRIYIDCLDSLSEGDMADIGSLWVIYLLTRQNTHREIALLTSEYNLTPILINELEAAILDASESDDPSVLNGQHNIPRKELLSNILSLQPSTIPKDLGLKFWELLVGPGAACPEDRDVAWRLLNDGLRGPNAVNPFSSLGYSEYLPILPPDCFCAGTLDFVREAILPFVNDETGNILDDEECGSRSALEQLWRLVLQAPEGTIENFAIRVLVRDVYLESHAIRVFPHSRARKIHLSLVNRCLQQMSAAATKLKSFGGESNRREDEAMEIIVTDHQILEQKLLFIRSLSVLREFHSAHRSMSHFSAPDLRPIINDSPKDVEGESAELKYQSFDGDVQTDVMPLNIGRRNTAASLFASLREATGFDNYRAYYRGRPFVPQENEICKSLEDLQIHNGIILVKRETDVPTSPTRVRPGASRVEVEILGHFEELWEYLSMEEKLAREMYMFLVKLPIDEDMLESIENPSTSYQTIFSIGQPYKTMYAVHALRKYHDAQHDKLVADFHEVADGAMDLSDSACIQPLNRIMSLVVSLLSDPKVISQCTSTDLQIELGGSLVECFFKLLDTHLLAPTISLLDGSLLDRLLTIISTSLRADCSDSAAGHVDLCLKSILKLCSMNSSFMSAFCDHPEIPRLFERLLLRDPRAIVRVKTALLILDKVKVNGQAESDPVTAKFREFFWPFVNGLIGPAITQGTHSAELLELCVKMFQALRSGHSSILDMQQLLTDWGNLLLSYTSTEDITQPDEVDQVAVGLVDLLHELVVGDGNRPTPQEMQPSEGMARKIFWKHLFPGKDGMSGPNRPILNTETRYKLMRLMMSLIGQDPKQLRALLEDLHELVPVYPHEQEFYAYELSQQFDRHKAVKSACGYVGLRNLSNTCYFNSLFTQLFMNTGFRQFMLNATVQDTDGLLFQTKKLFAFMQASLHRSMNPEDLISSIRTYEDSAIDIHNQMDVDEFYNLLFDRWEAQLASSEEKRQFRSFYGGQLVQQVASKECDHISERFEPFSAIQCDIKGKTSLEESLQAYVDGEIMEGDNKYKCSTCDRHVDAVKRACLKDIPDNLIFHLKRFDFNLRTMMRNKINDYFAFPTTIDMQPYTMEHLSGNGEDRPKDIFELVGVLVHSGTAESGHYYSYVRERPSSNSSAPVWVEFNDENVSSWDPANMEAACFGGQDMRSHFENSGLNYDKTYSAYMLFYQRATSLAKEQDVLKQSNCTSPLRVDVPDDMGSVIEGENLRLLQRHCLYDSRTIWLVRAAVLSLKDNGTDKCSEDHRTEILALTTALSFLDQVASRAKDIPDFFRLYNVIVDVSRRCAECSLAVYTYFEKYTEAFRQLVQRNLDGEVRQYAVNLMIRVLKIIRTELPLRYGLPLIEATEDFDDDDGNAPPTVMEGVTNQIFKVLWDSFQANLRSWNEVFELMLSFVSLGRHEIAAFLKTPYLRNLMLIVYADPHIDLPIQFSRMITNVARRPASRPPSYDCIIDLLNVLLGALDFHYTEHGDLVLLEYPEQRLDHQSDLSQPFCFARPEFKILQGDWVRTGSNIFFDKLIGINQNIQATKSIVGHLMRHPQLEEKLFLTLKNAITGQAIQHQNTPYLRIAGVFCRKSARPELIESLIRHICSQCMTLQNVDGKAFFDFQREVFAAVRENSGETIEEIVLAGYDHLCEWVPGLLAYFDTVVVDKTESFLQEKIFKYGSEPALEDTDSGRRRASKILESARMVGLRCSEYLNEQYLNGRGDLTARTSAPLQRVLRNCLNLFYHVPPGQDEAVDSFLRFGQATLESVQQAMLNNSSDNGSEWEGSSVCSEQMDSLGDIDMPAAGDLNDGDLQ